MNSQKQKTILLVEDDALTAVLNSRIVNSFGYEVLTADTGEKAVELALINEDIDLVLMDIDLGAGIEGTEASRQILDKRHIPIVFFTSHDEKEYVDKVKEITRYGYLIKGSNDFVLNESIQMAFELFDAKRQLEKELSERKLAEEKFSKLFYINPSACGLSDLDDHKYIEVNEAFYTLFGFDKNEVIGKTPSDLGILSSETIKTIMTKADSNGNITNAEAELRTKNGDIKNVLLSAANINMQDKKYRFTVVHDITNYKQMENKLRENEKKFRGLFESSRDAIMILEPPTWGFTAGNSATIDMFKAKSVDAFISHGPWKLSPQYQPDGRDSRDKSNEMIEIAMKEGSHCFEWTHKRIDGEEFPASVLLTRMDLEEKIFIQATVRDITENKKAAVALRESNELLQKVLDTIPQFICWKDRNSVFLGCNKNYANLVGLPDTQTIIGKTDWDLPWKKEETEHFLMYDRKIMETNTAEYHIIESAFDAKGRASWLDTSKAPLHDAEGNVNGILVAFEDITERKMAEKVQESENKHRILTEEKYRSMVENINDVMYTIDLNDIITYVSPAVKKITKYNPEDLTGQNFFAFIHEDDRGKIVNRLKQLIEGDVQPFEYRLIDKDGSILWVRSFSNVEKSETGEIIGITGIFSDITERKLAQEQIQALLAEKEIILKEVHHRIKNNMTTINNLLILQTDELIDHSAIAALEDASGRVQSMMMLYDKLYQSASFEDMSIKDYLPSLIDQIISNFPNKISVKIVKDIGDFILNSKKLSTLGIIINELLTNIMKHAFTGRNDGLITISASLKDHNASLIIQDNGNGIPKSVDFKDSNGFGLMLVDMMTKQLRGSIRIERENGTRIILEFKIIQ